uniref:LRRCT domain-containing protein n=1 Tax=Sphenodon punctatus TaxID=8508 RepID=A0A8D0H786_SPHPU
MRGHTRLAVGMLLLPLLQAGGGCPSHCYCFATPALIQCSYVRLQEPPRDLPPSVHNLTIVGSNLTVLRRAAFAGGPNGSQALAQLTLLLLTHDHIQGIEELAFQGLPALGTLDLSHNPLLSIADGALSGCGRLRTLRLHQALRVPGLEEQLGAALANLSLWRLELGGNGLRALPMAALPPGLEELDLRNNSLPGLAAEELAGLEAPPLGRLRLWLGSNPLRCQCARLRPLLAWLRNASSARRLPDGPSLRCASPPARNGSLLLSEALGCEGEGGAPRELGEAGGQDGEDEKELETASYVFFGIVLALIGVVFLMVLYLNRRGIKRWLNNLREACRDQMEGYHYRYEQDADPRRGGIGVGGSL